MKRLAKQSGSMLTEMVMVICVLVIVGVLVLPYLFQSLRNLYVRAASPQPSIEQYLIQDDSLILAELDISPEPPKKQSWYDQIMEKHRNRNQYNVIPQNQPRWDPETKTYRDGFGNIWHKDWFNPHHKGNVFRGTGRCEGSEAVYHEKTGALIQGDGTYNFSLPGKDPMGHLFKDMVPHYIDHMILQNPYTPKLDTIYNDRYSSGIPLGNNPCA